MALTHPAFCPDRRGFGISRETCLLGFLSLADLVGTLYLIRQGLAVEGNPLLAPFMAISPAVFSMAKALLTIPQLLLLEWIARRHPHTVRRYGRAGICGYVLVYVAGGLLLNHG